MEDHRGQQVVEAQTQSNRDTTHCFVVVSFKYSSGSLCGLPCCNMA